jgi:carboxypeptidase D
MELTLELSQDKYPSASRLPAIWAENRDALLALALTASLGGARGSVKSAEGKPLGATLVVKSSSGKAVPFYSDPATGFFARPLAPGRYTVVASAPGYVAASAEVVVPAGGAGVVNDFVLKRAASAAAPAAGAGDATDGARERPAALLAGAGAGAAAPVAAQSKGR